MMTLECRPRGILCEINSGATVVYTVVSRGRVLGTTELEFMYRRDRLRCGGFWPAPGVENLMEVAVGVSPAILTAYKANVFDPPDDHDPRAGAACAARQKATTEHADVQSAYDREKALALELHGPDGSLIETEDIGIRDTEFALSLVDADVEHELNGEFDWDESEPSFDEFDEFDEFDDELFAEADDWADDCDPEWAEQPEKPFARYQIFVTLVDDAAIR
jgi:hypothetical protein